MSQARIVELMEGGLDVNLQDQTTDPINLYMVYTIQSLTLISNATIDSSSLTVSSLGAPVAGNIICIKQTNSFYQGNILSVVANGANWDITVDTPLDFAFTTLALMHEGSKNIAVDGSVTPVIFSISPSNLNLGTEWDITNISILITDASEMDDTKFGGIAALTKGVFLRKVDGVIKNIFNVKTNGDIALNCSTYSYADKAGAGNYGFRAIKTFGGQENQGVIIRLVGDTQDTLEIVVQDNLTGLTGMYIMAKGHTVSSGK